MTFGKKSLPVLCFVSLMVMFSCVDNQKNTSGVEAAMRKYDRLILKMDADSISQSFTPDGNLGNIAIGRDSIKKFLLSIKNVRVLSQSSSTSAIEAGGDSAIQKGTYDQIALVSEKDTIKVKGEYVANWQWISDKGWFIRRLITKRIR